MPLTTNIGAYVPSTAGNNMTTNIGADLDVVSLDHNQGELDVSAAATCTLTNVNVPTIEGELDVSASATVALANESFLVPTTWPNTRPSDYDPDLVWDEETGTWGAEWLDVLRSNVEFVFFIGEDGEIYFDENQ